MQHCLNDLNIFGISISNHGAVQFDCYEGMVYPLRQLLKQLKEKEFENLSLVSKNAQNLPKELLPFSHALLKPIGEQLLSNSTELKSNVSSFIFVIKKPKERLRF